MVVLCAVSANEKKCLWYFRRLARCKEKWLKEVVRIPFPNSIPSYDTIRRVLGMLPPKQFQLAFIKFMEYTLNIPENSYVSLDGKTLRGRGLKRKWNRAFAFIAHLIVMNAVL